MLKLPKGLKKKKKGKKSKKDQELFTEEELQQYRREHQQPSASGSSVVPSDTEDHPGGEKSENDEEWSKFAALTSGIDSVLKKTQGDLDRIKSTSFFQKVPTQVEQATRDREERDRHEQEKREQLPEEENAEQKSTTAEKLIDAVVELTDSESNSEVEEDDIFDTGYIDAIASGELPIAYVPDSPVIESFEGEDPFDTSYADKVIKGPEVSKRGKKLVSIGSAVEVLTGRVESAGAGIVKGNRQRRGLQNLLLSSFDEAEQQLGQPEASDETLAHEATAAAKKVAVGGEVNSVSLLDELTDCSDHVANDLSVSLHLSLQRQLQTESKETKEQETAVDSSTVLDLDEFDELKNREPLDVGSCGFAQQIESDNGTKQSDVLANALNQLTLAGLDESEIDDPFDTKFVEKILPATAVEDDEFDPRAEDEVAFEDDEFDPRAVAHHEDKQLDLLEGDTQRYESIHKPAVETDLLSGNNPELDQLPQLLPLGAANSSVGGQVVSASDSVPDPFDTSDFKFLVAPGKTELKFLEEELLTDRPATLNHSLSDPDFDPRADCEDKSVTDNQPQEENRWPEEDFQTIAQRKSSLSLHINEEGLGTSGSGSRSKSVLFAVPTPDLLNIDAEHSVSRKPLTPYYNRETIQADPFDTSFVPSVAPTQLELHLLDQELNSVNLKHSLSDPDFDPRADALTDAAVLQGQRSDLLGVNEANEDLHKVLTPAHLGKAGVEDSSDPFDTSIAVNLQPGRAELKLLEDELIPRSSQNESVVSDILSEGANEASSVFVKVLTPQASNTSLDLDTEQEEIDPFDTSFVSYLGPGKAEIKVLESELIDQ
ncbi:protein stoned-A [Anopheles ziemanni]|uniref:protein stoned-A n=1 Tax=Anopheles coustani TaxID=139045 RepID=UPI00265914F4|nr:protein stoned-A [Anopheles coustani]XP_058176440.1 protein stoned-A [Anopheles ziemanni]